LIGEIEIPLKVGIVGGSLQSNPTVALNLRLLGVESASELAEVMGAVGLAQNFAALRALATEGIQQGHMTLHARSVVSAAGAPPELFDTVVERVVESGEIKVWKAKELIEEVKVASVARPERAAAPADMVTGCGHGKIILFGEHAVVYGKRAIAAPIPLAVHARVVDTDNGVWIVMPRWGMEQRLHADPKNRSAIEEIGALILDKLGLGDRNMRIEVYSEIPRAMGLGGSAAVAVAIIRALDLHYELKLSDEDVNRYAYLAEQVAHGTPSGIDNTVATYGRPIIYRAGSPPQIEELYFEKPIRFVIGITGSESLTAKTVARVRTAREKNRPVIDRVFKGIDALTGQALAALKKHDLEQLGDLMNVCHGLLNSLQVSSWELEELIQIARENGALGAKLTGGGGGGSMIALVPENAERVIQAMNAGGYQAFEVLIA
jgi:hydroxymethylglutaryl-CoA reductase